MIVNPPVSGMVRLRVPFHEFILGEKLSYWTKIFDLRKIFKGRKNIFALKKASDFLPWNQRLAFLILEIFNSAREKDFSLLRRGDWPERWRAWLMPHANESPKISQRPHFPQYIFSKITFQSFTVGKERRFIWILFGSARHDSRIFNIISKTSKIWHGTSKAYGSFVVWRCRLW